MPATGLRVLYRPHGGSSLMAREHSSSGYSAQIGISNRPFTEFAESKLATRPPLMLVAVTSSTTIVPSTAILLSLPTTNVMLRDRLIGYSPGVFGIETIR